MYHHIPSLCLEPRLEAEILEASDRTKNPCCNQKVSCHQYGRVMQIILFPQRGVTPLNFPPVLIPSRLHVLVIFGVCIISMIFIFHHVSSIFIKFLSFPSCFINFHQFSIIFIMFPQVSKFFISLLSLFISSLSFSLLSSIFNLFSIVFAIFQNFHDFLVFFFNSVFHHFHHFR